jgi:hypothetical protein
MKERITAEIIDVYSEDNQWFLLADDLYTKERYWVHANKEIFEEVWIGDMFRMDVEPGLPLASGAIKSFRAIKAELTARYPTKVRNVLDI